MKKGDQTRLRVLHDVGGLLNRTGYLSTPLSSILDTVGLQKGGLYNHFESKEALALEAFRENLARLGNYLQGVALSSDDPRVVVERLLEASVAVAAGSVVAGGCPVLNAGTESDDLSESLRLEAARGWEGLKGLFLTPLRQLQAAGRLIGTSPEAMAVFLTAVVEGGILSAKVTGRVEEQRAVLQTARQFLEGIVFTKEQA